MYKKLIISIVVVWVAILVLAGMNKKSQPTVKYFPINEWQYFEGAKTSMSYIPNNNKNKIVWQTQSTSNEPAFLRQDISLLYGNGYFKGIQQKWKQNVAEILLRKNFKINHPIYLNAISFHHAEIHQEDETISSIQKMTTDQLYYVTKNKIPIIFRTPKSTNEEKIATELNDKINHELSEIWNSWISYHNLNIADYKLVPLSDLIYFQENPIGHFSMSLTEQIIGQLWEGLYQNYVTILMNEEVNKQHAMPVILIARDHTHLIVLYEIANDKIKLMQQLPTAKQSE